MVTTVGGGRLDRSAPGQATQHALLSPSFLPHCPSAGSGGGGVNPSLSPAYGRFVCKGHHLQSPAFRQDVFLHNPQEWDFYEHGLTENDLGGLFRAPWS